MSADFPTDPVRAVAEALRKSRMTWGTHSDRWADAEWQGEFWTEVAEAAVAAARPAIAAEALRAAAGEWMQGHWADDLPPQGASRPQLILGMAKRATAWLRDRADRIEREGQ